MAGVWDALGRGIESGVSAFLQGQEQQLRRRREEEEKAQREKEWLFNKMRGEAGLSMAERQFGFEQEQAKAATAEQLRRSQEATAASATEFERKKELIRLSAGLEAGKKEPTKDLYSPKGFNGEVALWLAMGNLGIQTDLELDQLLNGPQGQAMATSLVNRLVSVHGERWPGRNLAGDFWQFLKARNPKLQSPADIMASEAAQAQAQAQQQAGQAAAREQAIQQRPVIAAETQQAAQRGLAAGGAPVPIAAGMPAAMQANVQPFTQDDLAKLRMYDEAPEMTKPMMKNVEPFRSLLMRRGR